LFQGSGERDSGQAVSAGARAYSIADVPANFAEEIIAQLMTQAGCTQVFIAMH